MEINVLTYNEALTKLCDFFDSLILPKKITRSNTNIVYLILKAFAKGWEILNNVIVALSNKFDPANCSDEDLVSVSALVGTERLKGSASGLEIIVTNPTDNPITLLEGEYYYDLDADTRFTFEVLEDTVIAPTENVAYIAMSNKIDSYPVTEQATIVVKGVEPLELASGLTCSNTDNENLLGTEEESLADFRQRILTDVTRQDVITELETSLRNLPYLFDCRVKFNSSSIDTLVYDDVSIPPLHMAIFYSGSARNGIADVVADKVFYPSISTEDSVIVKHINDCFVSGEYDVNIIPMKKKTFSLHIDYSYDPSFITDSNVRSAFVTALKKAYNRPIHTSFVKENDIYNILTSLNLSGVNILNVDILYNGSQISYMEVPYNRIAWLDTSAITYNS